MDQATTPDGSHDQASDAASRAVIRRPEQGVISRSPGRRLTGALPALVTDRLPALWGGGRGPLAQAVLAGGLLALGSVVGRRAVDVGTALVPPSGTRTARPATPAPGRTYVEAETSEGIVHSSTGATIEWRTRRVRITRTDH